MCIFYLIDVFVVVLTFHPKGFGSFDEHRLSVQACGYLDHHLDALHGIGEQEENFSTWRLHRILRFPLRHHREGRFCGGSATESAHDGTIQMATTTWPVDGINLSGFRVR